MITIYLILLIHRENCLIAQIDNSSFAFHKIVCNNFGKEFFLNKGEVDFYLKKKDKGFVLPKKCKRCKYTEQFMETIKTKHIEQEDVIEEKTVMQLALEKAGI